MNRQKLTGIAAVSVLLSAGLAILLFNREKPEPPNPPAPEIGRLPSVANIVKPESSPPAAVRRAADVFSAKKKHRKQIAEAALSTPADSLEALEKEARTKFEDPDEIALYIGKGLAVLGRKNFEHLHQFVSEKPFPDHGQILDHFLETWDYETFETPEHEPARLLDRFVELAAESPEAAAEIAEALPEGDLREVAAFETAESWALANLDGALGWLESLAADSPIRPWVADGIAETWTGRDPSGAATWAVALSDPVSRRTALATTLSSWAQKQPEIALAWVSENVPVSGELWTELAPVISGSLGSVDLETARNWTETLPAGAGRDSAVLSGALEAVANQPEATMNWLIGLGETEAIFHTAAAWAAESPVALSGYLRELPPSQIRDRAILGMVAIHSAEDPEFSLHWALDIDARRNRDEGMRFVIESLLDRDGLRRANEKITNFAGTLESEGHSADADFLRASAQRILFGGDSSE